MTSKERAELRALATQEPTILIVGKEGVTDAVIASAQDALRARELVKGKVLESSLLSAREASDALAEACGAETVQSIGTKFVLYRKKKEPKKDPKRKPGAKAAAARAIADQARGGKTAPGRPAAGRKPMAKPAHPGRIKGTGSAKTSSARRASSGRTDRRK